MIFNDSVAPLQSIIHKKGVTFGEWVSDKLYTLFLPRGEENYSTSSILYLFMKRLHQSYETVMRMDEEERDEIFGFEKSLMDKEAEESKKTKR